MKLDLPLFTGNASDTVGVLGCKLKSNPLFALRYVSDSVELKSK